MKRTQNVAESTFNALIEEVMKPFEEAVKNCARYYSRGYLETFQAQCNTLVRLDLQPKNLETLAERIEALHCVYATSDPIARKPTEQEAIIMAKIGCSLRHCSEILTSRAKLAKC